MKHEKGLLVSETFWGALIAGLPAIDWALATIGVIANPMLADLELIIASAAGAILAGHGRIRASKRIRGLL